MTTRQTEIADELTGDILARRYRPGERLPSERDLTVRFGASRGAVREAMSKLAQLGLATITPGGARVNPIEEASLDVIGHMLSQGPLPDPVLVGQILNVITALLTTAAEDVLDTASEEDIEAIRALVEPLMTGNPSAAEHLAARTALMRGLMIASNNLVCQLIARTLFEQLVPGMSGFTEEPRPDRARHQVYARRLDAALANRDIVAVREIFVAMSHLTRDSVLEALTAARAQPQTKREAATL